MQNPFGLSGIQGVSGGVSGVTGVPGVSVPSFAEPSEEEVNSFSSVLANSMEHVNQSLDAAKVGTQNLLSGNTENLHDITIAGAKSEVMMKLTTTVVGKLAQATTQLFQMQM